MPDSQNKSRDVNADGVPETEGDDDLQERRYYYDDAHGYEDFDPEEPEEDESE